MGTIMGASEDTGLSKGWVQRQKGQAGGIQGQGPVLAGRAACPQAAGLQQHRL